MSFGSDHGPETMAWMVAWWVAASQQHSRVVASGSEVDRVVACLIYITTLANVQSGASAILGRGNPALAAYEMTVPDSALVRNVVTHYVEYIRGAGHEQKARRKRGEEIPSLEVFTELDSDRGLILHVWDSTVNINHAHRAATALMVAVGEELDRIKANELRAGD